MLGNTINEKMSRQIAEIAGLSERIDVISHAHRNMAINETAWCNRNRLKDSALVRVLHKAEQSTSVLGIGFGAISGMLNVTTMVFSAMSTVHPLISVLNTVKQGCNVAVAILPVIQMGVGMSSRIISEKKREQNAVDDRKVLTFTTQMNDNMERMRSLEADTIESMRAAWSQISRNIRIILQSNQ